MLRSRIVEQWSLHILDFGMRIVDCRKQGSLKGTAEALRAQRKPNKDKLTSKKYRNKFDVRIKSLFLLLWSQRPLRLCG